MMPEWLEPMAAALTHDRFTLLAYDRAPNEEEDASASALKFAIRQNTPHVYVTRRTTLILLM
jgi:hypothetical protein